MTRQGKGREGGEGPARNMDFRWSTTFFFQTVFLSCGCVPKKKSRQKRGGTLRMERVCMYAVQEEIDSPRDICDVCDVVIV